MTTLSRDDFNLKTKISSEKKVEDLQKKYSTKTKSGYPWTGSLVTGHKPRAGLFDPDSPSSLKTLKTKYNQFQNGQKGLHLIS